MITGLAPGSWRLTAVGNPHTGNVVIVLHIFRGAPEARRVAAQLRIASPSNTPIAELLERSAGAATATEGTA